MAEDMEMFLEQVIKKTNPEEYIKILEQDREDFAEEINRLNNIINETRRILGQYEHYSTPTEEQNAKNEAIVDEAYMQLHNNLKELKGDNK